MVIMCVGLLSTTLTKKNSILRNTSRLELNSLTLLRKLLDLVLKCLIYTRLMSHLTLNIMIMMTRRV